jgi:hypothetical protein
MKRGIVFLASLSIILGLVAAAPGPAAIPPSSPGNCIVTNTADSGPGSLRDCMDPLVAGDVITFDPSVFPPSNPQTITLDAFPLPDIVTDNVTIDGSNAGVVLNGSGLGFGCGLVISDANNVVIKGLQILNFPGDGISLQNGASNNTIGGVNGLPGGACTGDCNLISGNGGMGVFISGSGNTVSGNYIGTTVNGTAIVGNTYNGVYIKNGASYNLIGGDTPGERNLISGNGRHGVSIRYGGTMSNTVSGNYIGTDASGMAALGNSKSGVQIGDGAQYNVIGGSNASSGDSCSGDCNLLSGNGTAHTDHGVDIYGSGTTNNIVSGNYIGTNISGTAAIGNTGSGVMISDDAQDNVIGGDTPGERNLLSGNVRNGVSIRVSGTEHNQVIGNYIGTDASGTAAVGNGSLGVWIGAGAQHNIIGGATDDERNIISGNDNGVGIASSSNNTIIGNYIGTDISGTAAISNIYSGVLLWTGASYNLIGGDTTGERNLISGNGDSGVTILDSGTMSNTVSGNYIGTDVSGIVALGNTRNGVQIGDGAQYNVIGGSNASSGDSCSGDCNLISGNGSEGVFIYGSGTMSNTVSGNYIGTDTSGTAALSNADDGVEISDGASYNVIGGDTAGERNIISGHNNAGMDGIAISGNGTMSNTVKGNYIGTDVSGTSALPNGCGVDIRSGASGNVVSDNLISGNGGGVTIRGSGTMNNTLSGNKIGTDVSGTLALPNTASLGVFIRQGASGNTISNNLISGNSGRGIGIGDGPSNNNRVIGNYIGTNISGTLPIGNAWTGVTIGMGGQYNVIGGNTPEEHNLISGNGNYGVQIFSSGTMYNTVSGNYIGTDVSGTAAISNAWDGVAIGDGAQYNVIGGDTTPGAGNIIAFNVGDGVALAPDVLNTPVLSNTIFSNGGLGIDLGGDGVTPNDPGDGDTGANNLQNFPVLTSAISDAASTTIEGTLNSMPNTTFRLEFFSNTACDPSGFGEGETLLGSTTVATDGSGDASFTVAFLTLVPEGQFVTATATDPDDNTSEFCQCLEVDDGISDPVDGEFVGEEFVDQSTVFSNNFTDEHLGGTSFGSIVDRGGLVVTVQEAANPDGLRLEATGGPGVAEVSACNETLLLTDSDIAVVTCGSLTAQVLVGPIEILLGTDIVVTVPGETTATVTEVAEGQFEIENWPESTGTIVVEFQGEMIEFDPGESGIPVIIDIKPGSDPNCFNNDGHGVIPVAILSSADFDATQVDPSTVSLNGQAVRVVGKGNMQAHIEDVNGDGLDDLVVQIEDVDGTYQEGDTIATLTGATSDGASILGTDALCIVP